MKGTLRGVALAVAVLAASPAMAFDNYTFTAALYGGFGGSLDVSDEDPFDQTALQIAGGVLMQERTFAVLRVGRIEFENDHLFADRLGAELEFLNLSGEYRFRQPAYDFGLFIGVGSYRLSGKTPFGGENDETVIGFALGATGDFDLTRHLSIVAEIDFHYALFDEANLYGAALAGLAVHF